MMNNHLVKKLSYSNHHASKRGAYDGGTRALEVSQPCHIDELIRESELPAKDVSSTLIMMELKGVKHPSLRKGWACEPTALASGKLTGATARLAWSSSALRGV